ncbi:CsbD family protein [Marinibacterium profundimaris]|uniref:General stress protein CsbD n=1 Tax=Marinibacterium profundimaris TaxID=1679460 RepID=A0A225NMH4_9RHOB|nr:CsbD family protein [Marinibacterium profundimaris]OWU75711.1 general stress protein CsbD [Marinibacterium profundimaris]
MNNDQIMGKWTEVKGKLREKYGELTDDELEQAKGDREQIEGKLQQRYGQTKEEAKRSVDDILAEV